MVYIHFASELGELRALLPYTYSATVTVYCELTKCKVVVRVVKTSSSNTQYKFSDSESTNARIDLAGIQPSWLMFFFSPSCSYKNVLILYCNLCFVSLCFTSCKRILCDRVFSLSQSCTDR